MLRHLCSSPFAPFPGCEQCDVIEIEIKPHTSPTKGVTIASDIQNGFVAVIDGMPMKPDGCDGAMIPKAVRNTGSGYSFLMRQFTSASVIVSFRWLTLANNVAEQTLRGPVVGRKNYYDSRSDWSMELAVWFFTVLKSLKIWKINQKLWLKGYLEACIANDRKQPEDLSRWLPWQMDVNRLNELQIHDPPA